MQVEYQLGEEVGHLFYYLVPKIPDNDDLNENNGELVNVIYSMDKFTNQMMMNVEDKHGLVALNINAYDIKNIELANVIINNFTVTELKQILKDHKDEICINLEDQNGAT